MMIRVLLAGEGSHDMGQQNLWEPRDRRYYDIEGWLQPLVRQFADGRDATFIYKRRSDLRAIPGIPRHRGPLVGHAEKAYFAMRQAHLECCNIVVFMVDGDKSVRRDHARWQTIWTEIREGFESAGNPVCGVCCIPVSASESWLLADPEAWSKFGLVDLEMLPCSPETIWGEKNDPNSNRPHNYFRRVTTAAGHADGTWIRSQLAGVLSISTLQRRCPTSFGPFADELSICLAAC